MMDWILDYLICMNRQGMFAGKAKFSHEMFFVNPY